MPREPKEIKSAWRYEQMNCAALMKRKQTFNDKTRFYFALGAAVSSDSKIRKPIKDIAFSAGVDYRNARKYLNEFIKTGEVVRTGVPRHYEYELIEHLLWKGSEESRNERIQQRNRKTLERITSTGQKIRLIESKD